MYPLERLLDALEKMGHEQKFLTKIFENEQMVNLMKAGVQKEISDCFSCPNCFSLFIVLCPNWSQLLEIWIKEAIKTRTHQAMQLNFSAPRYYQIKCLFQGLIKIGILESFLDELRPKLDNDLNKIIASIYDEISKENVKK